MLHLFTEIESEVAKLGDAMKGVFSKVHATVSEAAEFSKEELQAGLAEFLAGLNGVDFSISQAFEAGATYAADKLKGVVAPVVKSEGPEPPVLTDVVQQATAPAAQVADLTVAQAAAIVPQTVGLVTPVVTAAVAPGTQPAAATPVVQAAAVPSPQ